MRYKLTYILICIIYIIAQPVLGHNKIDKSKIYNLKNKKPAIDTSTYFDANNIKMGMRNTGQLIDPFLQFEWPKNSGLYTIFTGGLWVAGKINNETRIAAVLYDTSAYLPGTIINGVPQSPNNPRFKFYKIFKTDSTGTNSDYDNWPVEDGAPILPDSSPIRKSFQNIWCVYNDSRNQSREFSTLPLSVEVQQYVYGDSIPGQLENTVFAEFKIINKGSSVINDAYIGIWLDCDIGFFADDLVGIDTSLKLAYSFNHNDEDLYYGDAPPALGLVILKMPVENENSYSFIGFKYLDSLWDDPINANEAYNFMKGLKRDGSSIIDPNTNEITRIMYSGDPITQTGWIDTSSNDKKMLLSFGPINMQPYESRNLHFALTVGSGNDRLSSLSNLKENIQQIKDYYNEKLIRTLLFSTYNINFDTLAVGLERSYDLIIKNTGEANVEIDSIICDNDNFTVNHFSFSLNSGDSSIINIKFLPQIAEQHNGKIIFYHNAFKNQDTIIVQGRGIIYQPLCYIPTPAIDFDTVFVDSFKVKDLRIHNSGNAVLKIDSIISTNPDFSIITRSLDVAPFDSANISVKYSPSIKNSETGFAIIYHNAQANIDSVTLSGKKFISKSLPLLNGWNLLSLPIKSSKSYVYNLYPSALSKAYNYNNGYVANDSVISGIGFWLKFPNTTVVEYIGKPISVETLYVEAGWNLIGAPSYNIETAKIIQIPDNIIISDFYKFIDSYIKSYVLEPGYGYWVKIKNPGTLIFNP